MKANQSKTVVFVTGAFVHSNSWNEWKTYFESKGYTTLAPSWPHKDATPESLRNDANPGLAALSLKEVVDHYAKIIAALPEKPIIIGHSLGGLMTQLLIQRDLGVAGIAIHPAPPQGVLTLKFSFLKSVWGPLGYFTNPKKNFMMSLRDWKFAFTNGMTEQEQQESYKQFTIPESKKVSRTTLTNQSHIDFKRPHAPLLITSGSEDNILPASLNYTNFKRYKQNNGAVTDYKEFPGRNHFVLGQASWKEDADYILDWISKH